MTRQTPRRIDENQAEIVAALRMAGCFVMDTSHVGMGFPDLIVARAGELYLIEIKNPRARGKLNKKQLAFRDEAEAAGATVHVCETEEAALRAVGLLD